MDNESFEMKDEFADKAQNTEHHNWEETPSPENEVSPVIMRRRIKGGYNWAGSVILFQCAVVLVVVMIVNTIYSTMLTTRIMTENPGMQYNELIAKVTETAAADTDYMVVLNSVGCVIADLAAFLIAVLAARRFKIKEMFGKPEVSAGMIATAVLACLGLQGVSLHIQNFVMTVTGYTGISEEMAASLSFSDNPLINVILVLYAVILGPVLEELMFRGAAMNLLAPVNRKFALIASSLLFALMHCNFNQIFNAFLLGMVFGYIALKSGSIIPSIICHIFTNANAFIMSFVFEEKLAASLGAEKAMTYEMIAFTVEAVIGIVALIFLLKKCGKVTYNDIVTPSYTYITEEKEEKKLTVKAFLTSPTVIVSIIYCVGTACMYVTKIPAA